MLKTAPKVGGSNYPRHDLSHDPEKHPQDRGQTKEESYSLPILPYFSVLRGGGRERDGVSPQKGIRTVRETPADSMPRLVLAVCAAGAAAAVYALHRRRRRPVHVGPHSAVGVVGMGVMGSQVSHCNSQ